MHTTNQWKDEGGYIARILRSSRVPTWAFIQPREIVYPKPTSSVNRASSTLRLVCPFNASLHVLPLIESSTRKSSVTHLEFQLCQLKKKIHRATKFPIGHLSGKLWAAELKLTNFLMNRIIFINVTNFVTPPPFNKHFCICDACSKFYMLAMWLFSTF